MRRTVIIDYHVGNLDSVRRAMEECGADASISDDPRELRSAQFIVLPGQGAFLTGMRNLHELGFIDALNEQVIENKIPFLGICLGMQLLAQQGFEGEQAAGLGWIPGEVHRLRPKTEERLPHVGWNDVRPVGDSPLFRSIGEKDFYFLHSYVMTGVPENNVLATTDYGQGFASAVGRDNIFGVQFHPEKSQQAGFALLRNFLAN
jgi:glutamine amidotransferase